MPDNTTMHPASAESMFSDIEDIIDDIRAGKMVIMGMGLENAFYY